MTKKCNWTYEEDEKVIRLFKQGYVAQEIARKVDRTKGSVIKRIQKLKAEERIINVREIDRKIKRLERKEEIKAINYEANRHMSNRAMVLSNPSVYINNSKGDLVLNKDNGYEYSFDMPRSLINTEKREYEKFRR